MTDLPDKILTDLGRVVIKAADLESALGVLAGHTHGLNMMDVLGRPGGALRAARRAVDDMQEAERQYFSPWIERAAELLTRRHLFVHAMWGSIAHATETPSILAIHMRTFTHTPVDGPTLQSFIDDLTETRRAIVHLLIAKINGRPLGEP